MQKKSKFSKFQTSCAPEIPDLDRDFPVSLNSLKQFLYIDSLINICYLSTLAMTFFRRNTNFMLKNTDLLEQCKSRKFRRKSLIFDANFRIFT